MANSLPSDPTLLNPSQVKSALARFKFAAFAEGVALFVLCVIMVFKYVIFPESETAETVSTVWSPIHGLIYIIYIVIGFDLWSKMRWHVKELLLIAFYGLIPVLSFFGEKWISQNVHDQLASEPDGNTAATNNTKVEE